MWRRAPTVRGLIARIRVAPSPEDAVSPLPIAQVRLGISVDHRPRLQTLEPLIRATLDSLEAYNDVPGRDPQNR